MPNLQFPTRESRLPGLLRQRDLLPDFLLLDVGAKGGILPFCRVFGDRLCAVGFDGNVEEVEQLNAAETNPNVKYEAAFIGCDNFATLFPPELHANKARSKNNDPGARLSYLRALAAIDRHAQAASESAADVSAAPTTAAPERRAEARYSIDSYTRRCGITDVDMIKIDTDGSDLEVLLSAEKTVRERGTIAVHVECPLIGIEHPYSNVFHNIHRVMRGFGFTMFAMQYHCYSRAALPANFTGTYLSSTMTGQPWWSDVLYFRDLADPEYSQMHNFTSTTQTLLKLCCLFEVFDLPDCAAELLLRIERERQLDPELCRELLDALVPGVETYEQYIARFEANPGSFVG